MVYFMQVAQLGITINKEHIAIKQAIQEGYKYLARKIVQEKGCTQIEMKFCKFNAECAVKTFEKGGYLVYDLQLLKKCVCNFDTK